MNQIPNGYPASAGEAFAMLTTRDRLTIDDLKVLAMIEQSGEAFYMAIARALGNPKAAALLESNAHEELGHAHRLLNAIRLLGDNTFALPKPEDNPFALPAFFDDIDVSFLKELAEGEQGGDVAYNKWADNEPNTGAAHLYRLNGGEEGKHSLRVAEVIALMQ